MAYLPLKISEVWLSGEKPTISSVGPFFEEGGGGLENFG